eukprot:Seg1323.6 transcript_id=Seg1323.6/GoldUCD/mRNA.D3Y31 product="hypothetical protein" protein_id=Seg1323.6/GoldUCD/D3Y31
MTTNKKHKSNEAGLSDNAADIFKRVSTNASSEVSLVDSISFDVLDNNGEDFIKIDQDLSNEEDFMLFLSDDSIEAENNGNNGGRNNRDNGGYDNGNNGGNLSYEKDYKEDHEDDVDNANYQSPLFTDCFKAVDSSSWNEDDGDNKGNEKSKDKENANNENNENNVNKDKANGTYIYSLSNDCREAGDNVAKENSDNRYKGIKGSDTKDNKSGNNVHNEDNKSDNNGPNEDNKSGNNGPNEDNESDNNGHNEDDKCDNNRRNRDNESPMVDKEENTRRDAFETHPIWSEMFSAEVCTKEPLSILEQQLQKSKDGHKITGNRTILEEQGNLGKANSRKNRKRKKKFRQKEISVTDESKFRAGGKKEVEISMQEEVGKEHGSESGELIGSETCTKTEMETGKEGDTQTNEIQSDTKMTDTRNEDPFKDSLRSEFRLDFELINNDEQGKIAEKQLKEDVKMICTIESELPSPIKQDFCLKIDNVCSMKTVPSSLKGMVLQDKSVESKFIDFEVVNNESQTSLGNVSKHENAGTYTPCSDDETMPIVSIESGGVSKNLPDGTTNPDKAKEIGREHQSSDTANDLGIMVGEVYSINSRSPDKQDCAIEGLLSHKGTTTGKLSASEIEGPGNDSFGSTSSENNIGELLADRDHKISSGTNLQCTVFSVEDEGICLMELEVREHRSANECSSSNKQSFLETCSKQVLNDAGDNFDDGQVLDITVKGIEGEETEGGTASCRELSDITEGTEHLSVVNSALGMVEIEIGCEVSESQLLCKDIELHSDIIVSKTVTIPHNEGMCKDTSNFTHLGAEASRKAADGGKGDPMDLYTGKAKHATLKSEYLVTNALSVDGVSGKRDPVIRADNLAKPDVPCGGESELKMPCILDVGTVQKDGDYKMYKGSVLENLVVADSKDMPGSEKNSEKPENVEERSKALHLAEERSKLFDNAVQSIGLPIRAHREVYKGPEHERLACDDSENILEVGAMITLASNEERSEVLTVAEPRCKAFDDAVKAIGLPLHTPEGTLQATERNKSGQKGTAKRKRPDETDIPTLSNCEAQKDTALKGSKAPSDRQTIGAIVQSNQAIEDKPWEASKAFVNERQTTGIVVQGNQAVNDQVSKPPVSERQTAVIVVHSNQAVNDKVNNASVSERQTTGIVVQSNQALNDKSLKGSMAPPSDRQTTGAVVQSNDATEDKSFKAIKERRKHSSSKGSKKSKPTHTALPLEASSTPVFQQANNFITTASGFPRMLLVLTPQNMTTQNQKQNIQLPPFHPFPGLPVMGPFPVNLTSQQDTQSNNGFTKPIFQGPASQLARLLPAPTVDPNLPTALKVASSRRIIGGSMLNQRPAVVVTPGNGLNGKHTKVANTSVAKTGSELSLLLSQSMNRQPGKKGFNVDVTNLTPANKANSIGSSTRGKETRSDRISSGNDQDTSKLLAREPLFKRPRSLNRDWDTLNQMQQQSGLLGRMCDSTVAKDLGALFKKHAAKLAMPNKKISETNSGKSENLMCNSKNWVESENRTGERNDEALFQETNTDSKKSLCKESASKMGTANSENLGRSTQKQDSSMFRPISGKILEPEGQIQGCNKEPPNKDVEAEASKTLEELAKDEEEKRRARVERARMAAMKASATRGAKKAKMYERMRRLQNCHAIAKSKQTFKANLEWARANDYSASKALKEEVAKMIECSNDDNKPLLRSRFAKEKTQMNDLTVNETILSDNSKEKALSQRYDIATSETKLSYSGTEITTRQEHEKTANEAQMSEFSKEDTERQQYELTAYEAKVSDSAKESTTMQKLQPTTSETKLCDNGKDLEYEQIRLSEAMEVCAAIVENPNTAESVTAKITSTGNSISPENHLRCFRDEPCSFNSTNAGNLSERKNIDSKPGLVVNPAEACFMVVNNNLTGRLTSPVGMVQKCNATTNVGDRKILSHLEPRKLVEARRDSIPRQSPVGDVDHVPRQIGDNRASPIEVECYEPKLPHDENNLYFNVAIKSIAKNNLIFGCSPLLVSAPKLIDNSVGMHKKARRKRGRMPCNEKDLIQDKRQCQDKGLYKGKEQSLKNNQPIAVKSVKPSSPVNCLIWKNVRYNGKLIGRKRTLLDACPVLFSWECSHLFTGRKFMHDKQSVMNRLQKYEVRMNRIIQRHKRKQPKTAENSPEHQSKKGGSPNTPESRKSSPSSSLRATASQSPVNVTQEKRVSPKAKEVNSILLEKARQLSQHFFDKHRTIYGNRLVAQTNNQNQNTMGSFVQGQSPTSDVSRPFVVRSSIRSHDLTTKANSEYNNEMDAILSDIRSQDRNRRDGQVNSRGEATSENRKSNSEGAVNLTDCTCSQVVKSIGCNVFEHSISKLARSVTRHVRKRKFSSATDHRCGQCDRVLSSAKELTRHALYHLVDKAVDDNFVKGCESKPKKRRIEKEDFQCELRVVGFRENMAENHDSSQKPSYRNRNSIGHEKCSESIVVSQEVGTCIADPENHKETVEIESKAVKASTTGTNSISDGLGSECQSNARILVHQREESCINNPEGFETTIDITNKAVEASTVITNSRTNIAEIELNEGTSGDKNLSENEVRVQNSGTGEESTGAVAVNTDRNNVSDEDSTLAARNANIASRVVGIVSPDAEITTVDENAEPKARSSSPSECIKDCLSFHGTMEIHGAPNGDDIGTKSIKVERNSSSVTAILDRNQDIDCRSFAYREMKVEGSVNGDNFRTETAKPERNTSAVATDRNQANDDGLLAYQGIDIKGTIDDLNNGTEFDTNKGKPNTVVTIPGRGEDMQGTSSICQNRAVQLAYNEINVNLETGQPASKSNTVATTVDQNTDAGTRDACLTSHIMDMDLMINGADFHKPKRNSKLDNASPEQNKNMEETPSACQNVDVDMVDDGLNIDREIATAERNSGAVVVSPDQNFDTQDTFTDCRNTNFNEINSNAEMTTVERNSDAVVASSDRKFDTIGTSTVCRNTNVHETVCEVDSSAEIAALEPRLDSSIIEGPRDDIANIDSPKGDIANIDCPKGGDDHIGDNEEVNVNQREISVSPSSDLSRTTDDTNRNSPNVVYKAQFWKMHQIPRISNDRDSPVECSSGEGKTVWTPVYFDVPVKPVKWQCLNCRRKFRGITELKTHAEECRRENGLSRDLDSYWKN